MAELSSSEKTGGRSSLKKLSIRVDLTAMVDLAFLLITFFMLTMSLTKPRAMPLAMPAKGPGSAVAASSTITICLGKGDGIVWYRGMIDKPLSSPKKVGYGRNGLRRMLIEAKNEIFKTTGKNMMVVVKPSDHSVYANLVATLDELNITETPSYAIADISTKDISLLKHQGVY